MQEEDAKRQQQSQEQLPLPVSSVTTAETPALREYTILKAEQLLRIGQRDHLLYANLGIVGAVSYFAFSEHGIIHSLLVVPWASFILGWTYLCNDDKISAIRKYIIAMSRTFSKSSDAAIPIFEWESAHRIGKNQVRFKVIQLLVDITTFVLSGVAALLAYATTIRAWSYWQLIAVTVASVIMVILTREFLAHFVAEIKPVGASR